jgi:hypothetical protein
MECKYCEEQSESRLMSRSQVVDGEVETIDVCVQCWWFKEINTDGKNGEQLSEQESIEGRVPDKSESAPSSMGESTG